MEVVLGGVILRAMNIMRLSVIEVTLCPHRILTKIIYYRQLEFHSLSKAVLPKTAQPEGIVLH